MDEWSRRSALVRAGRRAPGRSYSSRPPTRSPDPNEGRVQPLHLRERCCIFNTHSLNVSGKRQWFSCWFAHSITRIREEAQVSTRDRNTSLSSKFNTLFVSPVPVHCCHPEVICVRLFFFFPPLYQYLETLKHYFYWTGDPQGSIKQNHRDQLHWLFSCYGHPQISYSLLSGVPFFFLHLI